MRRKSANITSRTARLSPFLRTLHVVSFLPRRLGEFNSTTCTLFAVGTWDSGPFDNDTAADFSADLDEAESDERVDLLRQALLDTAEEDDYLDLQEACVAVAAAAIVASQLPGGEPVAVAYAPQFLLDDPVVSLPSDLAPLAVRALDRVVADQSEWRDLWQDAFEDNRDAAFETVRRLREVLTRS